MARKGQLTLRISLEEKDNSVEIVLEGRVAGPWVAELRRFWAGLTPLPARKQLSINLRDVTYADAEGKEALSEICAQTGARLVSGTPWTQHLAAEISAS